MTVNSLSSSALSAFAISGLNQATNQITESTYRLSSGNRFFRAGDDVAALSISNRLQSDKVSLTQAQQNNVQANSLLQTAYGALSEINDILDTMRARATAANVGTLTAGERAAMDLEFQALRDEIDSIAGRTNFNGIQLIDGSISQSDDLQGATTNATQAIGAINFTSAIGGGQTININGTVLTEGFNFAAGASANDTALNLFNALTSSNDVNIRAADYQLAGTTINITARAGGTLGQQFVINEAGSSGAASFTTIGQNTAVANVFALQGGSDTNGLALGGTRVSGTIGDSLVNTQSQTVAQQTLTIINNANIDNNEQFLRIDDGTGGGTITFRARTAAIAAPEDFLRGATAEETLQNLVNTIEGYSTNSDFVLNQLEFEIQDNVLFIRGRTPGNVLDQTGANAALTSGLTTANEGVLSGTSLNNGTNTGVNADGVVNAAFAGTISGFSATFNGGNNITASITVGSETYTANITNTAPAANTNVRFTSSGGGYFDVQLASAGGAAVADQAGADNYASRLDAAFSTLTFTQERAITNFQGSGQLAGGNATFASDDFSDLSVDDVSVTDSVTAGGQAIVEVTVGGEVFRSTQGGSSIGANETLTLRSTANGNRFLQIQAGGTAIDLSNAANATTFENTLRTNFDLGNGSGEISFQIGASSADQLAVSIDSATSGALFNGATPDLTSQANAAAAELVIDAALDELGGIIAEVGSAQSRLTFAYNANASTINELEFARANLADTDIPSESVLFASAIVQQQASIAVLAQTQLLGSNLLDLLQSN